MSSPHTPFDPAKYHLTHTGYSPENRITQLLSPARQAYWKTYVPEPRSPFDENRNWIPEHTGLTPESSPARATAPPAVNQTSSTSSLASSAYHTPKKRAFSSIELDAEEESQVLLSSPVRSEAVATNNSEWSLTDEEQSIDQYALFSGSMTAYDECESVVNSILMRRHIRLPEMPPERSSDDEGDTFSESDTQGKLATGMQSASEKYSLQIRKARQARLCRRATKALSLLEADLNEAADKVSYSLQHFRDVKKEYLDVVQYHLRLLQD